MKRNLNNLVAPSAWAESNYKGSYMSGLMSWEVMLSVYEQQLSVLPRQSWRGYLTPIRRQHWMCCPAVQANHKAEALCESPPSTDPVLNNTALLHGHCIFLYSSTTPFGNRENEEANDIHMDARMCFLLVLIFKTMSCSLTPNFSIFFQWSIF